MFAPNHIRLLTFFLITTALTLAAGPAASDDLTGRWGVSLEGGLMKLTEGYWDYSILEM